MLVRREQLTRLAAPLPGFGRGCFSKSPMVHHSRLATKYSQNTPVINYRLIISTAALLFQDTQAKAKFKKT